MSDKPGQHDIALLKRLVLPDGALLRCVQPGRPTLDCLFDDVMRDGTSLLKVSCRAVQLQQVNRRRICFPQLSKRHLAQSCCTADIFWAAQTPGRKLLSFSFRLCWRPSGNDGQRSKLLP